MDDSDKTIEVASQEEAPLEPALGRKRCRKGQLYKAIRKQMEFYFSPANLSKDRYFSQKLMEDGCLPLSIFLQCNKIRALTNDPKDLIRALRGHELIKVSEDELNVSRVKPFEEKKDVDESMIYVENIPLDADHDWIIEQFSRFGHVDYVSLPKYKSGKLKGFAFVEFESPSIATRVVEEFKSKGTYLPTNMEPESLCSISTFEAPPQSGPPEDPPKTQVTETVSPKKKRKVEDVEEPPPEKKPKLETNEEQTDQETTNGEKRKRKRRKKNKKSKQETEAHPNLCILSKKDWKVLRNKYLQLQRASMKLLKKQLYRARDQTYRAEEQKEENQPVEPMVNFTPGVILKVTSDEPIVDVKSVKVMAKAHPLVKYVDVHEGSFEFYLRTASPEDSKEMMEAGIWPKVVLLEGEEEEMYWDKLQSDRQKTLSKSNKKERGRRKLARKSEKVLKNKIVFDNTTLS